MNVTCGRAELTGIVIAAILAVLSFSEGTSADMGRILTTAAKVEEKAQKAIILHNLEEEVLILGTDLQADRKTTILRFIPFPTEPQVSLHEGDPFKVVAQLMHEHRLVFLTTSKSGTVSASPVEIRLNVKLGAHDITVVKVNEIGAFRQWVESRLADKGLLQSKDFAVVQDIAADYVSRDIRFFVFDVVEVTPETRFVEPVVYRFKTKDLFYPLKTTNTFGGEGEIDLVVIAPGTLCEPLFGEPLYLREGERSGSSSGLGIRAMGGLWHAPRVTTSDEVSKSELVGVYSDAPEFFSAHDAVFMQLIQYNGPYLFEDDIMIDISSAPRKAYQMPSDEEDYDPFEDILRELQFNK
jgi:hypothetical protein